MLKLNKGLVVFVMFASVAFMAFAIVTTVGGYNFKTKAADMTDFVFERSASDGPWTVKTRSVKDETIGSGKLLPEVIIAAQKRKIADLQTEAQLIDKKTPELRKNLKDATDLIAVDIAAMKKHQEVLEKERQKVAAESVEASAQVVAKTKEVTALQDKIKLRRQEAILMSNQVKETRAQKQAAISESQRLRDLLYQAKGDLERAERRQSLLKADGAKEEEEYGVKAE